MGLRTGLPAQSPMHPTDRVWDRWTGRLRSNPAAVILGQWLARSPIGL